MKKRMILIVLILILVSLITFAIYSNQKKELEGIITGETVTGKAAETTIVSIFVLPDVPILTLLNPENKTYLRNTSILLNFTVSNEDSVWYNIDNGANTTVTSHIYFDTSQGFHTLRLYANNSNGNTTKNANFTVNITLFTVLHTEYNGTTKGNSTVFINITYEDIQSLSDIILENTEGGKIKFNEIINTTDDDDFSDRILDLDTHTNISNNRIELNSTALPNFDTAATLYLYNLIFSNPRILRDGIVCPSSICTKESFSGGTLIFNVTEFTIYSAEETPEKKEDVAPGPSGGGGSIFTTNIDEIKISLKQGEVISKEIKVENQKRTKLSFSISSDIEGFIKISEKSFELEPKEERTIIIDFIARKDTIPELYLGNLFIEAEGIKKIIPVTIEVESKEALFDVRLDIPEDYLQIYPEEELLSEIEIFNLVEIGKVNVTIKYSIKDQQNREILSEEEIFSVEKSISFVKRFEIPKDTESGRYILYVRVAYDGKVASASALFQVGERPFLQKRVILATIIGIILLIIIFTIIYRIKKKKRLVGMSKIGIIEKLGKNRHKIDDTLREKN